MASAPKNAARATRQAGQQTRASLLDAASELFAEKGLAGASMTEIASAADCFPSQVTYYFGDKEGLFVEVACRDVLTVSEMVEEAASKAETPDAAAHDIFRAAIASDLILSFAEAMMVVRRRTDLQPSVGQTFERLFEHTGQTTATILRDRGWTAGAIDLQVRAFWSTIIGVALARAGTGMGQNSELATASVASVLGFNEASVHQA
jgi:AcrR family transcriptional regulator